MIRPCHCGVGPVTSPVSGEVSSVCVWPCSATISGNEYGGKNNFSWSQASLPGLSDVRLVFQGCGQQCSLARGARARCGPSVSRGFGLSKKAARPAEAWGGPAPWDRCYHPSLPRAGAVVAIETSRPPRQVSSLVALLLLLARTRVHVFGPKGAGSWGDTRRAPARSPPFRPNQQHSFQGLHFSSF